MKSKQVLSVEQMKHLQELRLDTSDASMCYCCFYGNIKEEWELEIYEDVINQGNYIQSYSLTLVKI